MLENPPALGSFKNSPNCGFDFKTESGAKPRPPMLVEFSRLQVLEAGVRMK